MKLYKGFNKDMTCRCFRFEEGQTYELPEGEEAKLCDNGFHACENPLDCFGYYAPGQSVYHEVELDATAETAKDSKRVGNKIKIGAELTVANICKAHFEFVKEHTMNSEQGENNTSLAAQDCSSLAARNRSSLAARDYSSLAAQDCSSLAAQDRSSLAAGENSVIAAFNSKAKGGLNTLIALATRHHDHENGELKITDFKAAIVDGKTIKPDTWYKLQNGEFVECDEE